jgi:hypothetical protein
MSSLFRFIIGSQEEPELPVVESAPVVDAEVDRHFYQEGHLYHTWYDGEQHAEITVSDTYREQEELPPLPEQQQEQRPWWQIW